MTNEVNGDGQAEIIHGDSASNMIRIFTREGRPIRELCMDCLTRDGLAVGDVNKKEIAEILHNNRYGNHKQLRIGLRRMDHEKNY